VRAEWSKPPICRPIHSSRSGLDGRRRGSRGAWWVGVDGRGVSRAGARSPVVTGPAPPGEEDLGAAAGAARPGRRAAICGCATPDAPRVRSFAGRAGPRGQHRGGGTDPRRSDGSCHIGCRLDGSARGTGRAPHRWQQPRGAFAGGCPGSCRGNRSSMGAARQGTSPTTTAAGPRGRPAPFERFIVANVAIVSSVSGIRHPRKKLVKAGAFWHTRGSRRSTFAKECAPGWTSSRLPGRSTRRQG